MLPMVIEFQTPTPLLVLRVIPPLLQDTYLLISLCHSFLPENV